MTLSGYFMTNSVFNAISVRLRRFDF